MRLTSKVGAPMTHSWFYRHNSRTHGPVSTAEIKNLAGMGLLDANDLVWAEGESPSHALPADAVLQLSDVAALDAPVSRGSVAAGPVPDWLADVAAMESKGPFPLPSPTNEIPEWLEDLRLWF